MRRISYPRFEIFKIIVQLKSQPRLVLILFLLFSNSQPLCYKTVLVKKSCSAYIYKTNVLLSRFSRIPAIIDKISWVLFLKAKLFIVEILWLLNKFIHSHLNSMFKDLTEVLKLGDRTIIFTFILIYPMLIFQRRRQFSVPWLCRVPRNRRGHGRLAWVHSKNLLT